MAASYQTGTASSPIVLLQTLVTWLVAQGWTQDQSATDASGWRAHLHKNALYVNLRAAMNETIWGQQSVGGYGIGMYLGDGYSGAAAWQNQSGGPIQSGTAFTCGVSIPLGSGAIIAYHFFDNGADHITIVVERTPGLFIHLGWGPSLVKTGYAVDFPYFHGTLAGYHVGGGTTLGTSVGSFTPMGAGYNASIFANSFFRVDAATYAPRWIGITNNNATGTGWTGREGRSLVRQGSGNAGQGEHPNTEYLLGRTFQSAFTGALLFPVHCFVQNAATRWAPVGYPPTVFLCEAVGHGFGPGEIYAVGGINHMVFPNFAVVKAA